MEEALLFLLLLVVSLAVLIKAADWFIGAAERIGLALGISPLVIGITVVAFGTSLPELATSVAAVWEGTSEIVLGNVVGSNVTNILVVLGLSAFVSGRIELERSAMDVDVPLLVGSALLLWFLLWDGRFSVFEALICVGGMVLFLTSSLRAAPRACKADRPPMEVGAFAMLAVGGSLVYGGAEFTIWSIEELSRLAGVSPEIIALTAVALGTSLPEVVVSVQAARQGKQGIAVGNVIGSNVFNTYAVMGLSRLVGPIVVPTDTMHFGLPFMVAATVVMGFMTISGRLSRWEGGTLLLMYVFFLGALLSGAF